MSTQTAPRTPINFEGSTPIQLRSMRSAAMLSEESLVADIRSRRTPSQEVERRLVGMLKGMSVPVSQVRTASLCRGRSNSNSDA